MKQVPKFYSLFIPELLHVGTRLHQMPDVSDAHAFTNSLLSTYFHLKWEFLNSNGNDYTGLTQENRLCTQNSRTICLSALCGQ